MANILVVDDEAPIRDLMARVLTLDGHVVETASDGAEALETLTAREGGFDLMLTDIRMPLMDGIALALAAKRDYPGLTILMMTGYAEQRERARSLEAIVTDVLVKPFSLAQARASVAAALRIAA